MTWQSVKETLRDAGESCIHCDDCTMRCEVLEEGHNPMKDDAPGISVGTLALTFYDAIKDFPDGDSQAIANVRAVVEEHPNLVFTIRRCCMDAFCTLGCPTGVQARKTFSTLRELLCLCGLIDLRDFTSTQVDKEWDIFSVYRAVYGIYYEELPQISQELDGSADTLFFPGCALGSYAPELTREVFAFLQNQGYNTVLSLDCCGSPLRSPGLADRANEFARTLVLTAIEKGIKRVVFVCPGCRDEWAAIPESEALELVALTEIIASAGLPVRTDKLEELGKGSAPTFAVMDSCHDRDGQFCTPLRAILAENTLVELPYHGANAVCCGAAGSVSLVDPEISKRRVYRVLDEEPAAVGADIVVANCPVCAYTFAAERRANPVDPAQATAFCHYLDVLFDASFDWDKIFSQLEGMWTGEYGAWVQQQLL